VIGAIHYSTNLMMRRLRMNSINRHCLRLQLTASGLFSISAMSQTLLDLDALERIRSLLQALKHDHIRFVADPAEVASTWAELVDYYLVEDSDEPTCLQLLYTDFAQACQEFDIRIPTLKALQKQGQALGKAAAAEPWAWARENKVDALIVFSGYFKRQYAGSPIPILVPKPLLQEQSKTGVPIAQRLLGEWVVNRMIALLEPIPGKTNDLSTTFLLALFVFTFNYLVRLLGLDSVGSQEQTPNIAKLSTQNPNPDPGPTPDDSGRDDPPPDDPPPDSPPSGGSCGVRPIRRPSSGGGGDEIAIAANSPNADPAISVDYSHLSGAGDGVRQSPLASSGGAISGRAIADVGHHLYQFLVQNIPRLSREFSTGSPPVSPWPERTLVLVNFGNPHVQVPAVVIGASSGAIAVSEASVNAWENLPINAPNWTLANTGASADSLAPSLPASSIPSYANPSLNRLAGIVRLPIAVAANLTSDEFAQRLSRPASMTLGQTPSINPPGPDDPGRWLNADLAVVIRDIAGPALSPAVSTTGAQTIAIALGSGETVIDRFGGIGQGSNPLPSVIAEVDTLKFSGAGMTAQNLLLTQRGDDLVIAFAGVANTTVVLRNFALDHLDNLARSSGDTLNLGNILFDGDAAITDDFDVINAGDTAIRRVLKRNTTTFLNDLDNEVSGFDNSNDTINGQGGNDRLFGLGGNDTLRGGAGNDQLVGGAGNDQLVGGAGFNILTGDAGADTFVIALDGQSQVTDFNPTEDRIGLPNGLRQDQLRIESGSGINAGSTRIWVNGFWVMELTGVNPRALTTQNFVAVAYGSGPLPTITSA
jgi:Ca2+-binding RTX toxin-like protein